MFCRRRFYISHKIRSSKSFILILSKSVVRKQMDLVYPGKCGCKTCYRLDLFHRIIECRDHRNADHKPCFSGKRHTPCIFQHQAVGTSCKLLMFLLVHMLDVHKIGIKIWKNLFQFLPGRTGHTLYGCINTMFLGSPQKVSGKVCLAETFTA